MNDTSLLNPDGTHFKPSESVKKFIVSNETIDSFLKSDLDSSRVLLVGQKGSGKSTLIAYKNFQDRKVASEKSLNKFFIPEEGVELIQFSDQLSPRDISRNVKYTEWEKIFTVTFYYFILAKLKNQLILHEVVTEEVFTSLEFHDLFNPKGLDCTAISYSDTLMRALKNRSFLYKNQGEFIATAKQILTIYLRHKEVSIYLDNLDQALFNALKIDESKISEKEIEDGDFIGRNFIDLDKFVNSSPYSYTDNVVESWLHSHVGFFIALYKVNEFDRRLNLFSTLRLEAYEYFNFLEIRNKPQYRGIACVIKYTEVDYEEIYSNLLKLSAIEKNQIEAFDLEPLPHIWIKNSIYNSETFWSFVKRHTFGNPREITHQINVLKELLVKFKTENSDAPDRVLEFKKTIAEEALKYIFKDLRAETLPIFPFNELDAFFKSHKRNWITQEELNDNIRSLVVMLYRLGLVGVVRANGRKYEQVFLDKNVYYSNQEVSLPESKFYLLHPTLDHLLISEFENEDFYYPNCIIGNKKDFLFLMEMEYYVPKEINETAREHFESFYAKADQFGRYSSIQTASLNKFFIDIWDFVFDVNKGDVLSYVGDYINGGKKFHGLRKKNTDDNINALARNYKLRLIICFAALTRMIKSHESLIGKFHSQKFPLVTYFTDIRKKGDKAERYMKQLSDFEINIIEVALENPKFSSELISKVRKDFRLKREVDGKLIKIYNRLQRYK